ncbi:hypothetical protein CF319_g8149 [Tilletia indica]|uniref:Hydrophobin n=1 Tax=Tilletia indica TaxID=43049 RepID=A0A8T8SDS1_9BASI|nr:hypothetical protein CF319_g8149 [Tilletia indica]KAE8224684.1 hypothetical protein CF326_g7992 [Tilletia indica]KAE8237899.1 hypothetical protein A4X13_0g8596 [Tilletia indica]
MKLVSLLTIIAVSSLLLAHPADAEDTSCDAARNPKDCQAGQQFCVGFISPGYLPTHEHDPIPNCAVVAKSPDVENACRQAQDACCNPYGGGPHHGGVCCPFNEKNNCWAEYPLWHIGRGR